MKSIVFLFLIVFSLNFNSQSQGIEGYLKERGRHLSTAAHISNDFLKGGYSTHDNYTDVVFFSKDNFLSRTITTKLRLIHGFGNLYISDIRALSDDDITEPFSAFGKSAKLLLDIYGKIDHDKQMEIRSAVSQITKTDMTNWSGKVWALYYINLDYLDYLLNQ
jgi:hypothetical protein